MANNLWLAPKMPGTNARPVLGCMNFGKRTPEAEARRILDRALERGVTWLDTANTYNDGESERIVGRAVKGRRDAVRIATKVGAHPVKGGREGLAPQHIAQACDASLQRLGVDRIDLYYLHWPDPKTPIADTLGAMSELLEAGKIGAWAVSNYASWQIGDMNQLADVMAMQRPRVSQVIYNLLIRQLDLEYFAFAKQAGLHTTIYNPLAGGLLAGKGLGGQVEKGSRFDGNAMYQKRYLSDRFYDLVRAYTALAQDAGLSAVQLSYAWVAQRPGVDTVLLGPATVEQLDAGIEGCALQLPAGVAAKVDEIHFAYLGTNVSYARE